MSEAEAEGRPGNAAELTHHGNTPAAWTLVTFVLLAFVLGAIAMVIGPNWTMFWIAVGLAVVGILAGKVMQMMGMGARRARS